MSKRDSVKEAQEFLTVQGDLTEAQKKEVAKIQAEGGEVLIYKCHRCGKTLVRDKSIEVEAGDLCAHYDAQGITPADLLEHRKSMTVAELPEGMIKVSDLHKICEREGIPVNRMVEAIGRDRALKKAIDPRFQPVYHKNARWVSNFCATKEGLAMIRGTQKTKQEKIEAELQALNA